MVNKTKISWGVGGLIVSLIVLRYAIDMFRDFKLVKGGFLTWFFSLSFVPFAFLLAAIIGGAISVFEIVKGVREDG